MVTTFMSPSVERRIQMRQCIGTRLMMEQKLQKVEQRIQTLVQAQKTVAISRILEGRSAKLESRYLAQQRC